MTNTEIKVTPDNATTQENLMKTLFELEAENEKLKSDLTAMRMSANSYKIHYEKLKAEIERLVATLPKDLMVFCGVVCNYAEELIEKAKSEAVKEFAERLKETASYKQYKLFVTKEDIDTLLKEMG